MGDLQSSRLRLSTPTVSKRRLNGVHEKVQTHLENALAVAQEDSFAAQVPA
ncbi:hypothetical protein NIES4072_64680 [Nostoc commune NIES-4072]|uniref:Uncharacterized protein n=1 Tax=Nostoc commune NIES-4072 TaxID=2005467 RepID=A0A2R5FVG8_NOSCO|nr:hypothetical protein [Nostoc commune]BBD70088.1 hypothetical protein NIES4070_64990 [Nostoc commune HK-02]GBG22756.1 hypothetical protein NIES4072_64680 [Nostoc commune NIES-4072]